MAAPISGRLAGGTASVVARLGAIQRLALPLQQGGGGYPVEIGVVSPNSRGSTTTMYRKRLQKSNRPKKAVLGLI
ncbi:MAG: hypothetical protein HC866_06075 [Leptolyngbyaceae cyanobacterium RU_5_1]|nr:hypothetical protein [Leptolyngbyaceae cyanobacterium RU_5_1]